MCHVTVIKMLWISEENMIIKYYLTYFFLLFLDINGILIAAIILATLQSHPYIIYEAPRTSVSCIR